MNVEGCHLNFLPADREVFTQTRTSYNTKMDDRDDFINVYKARCVAATSLLASVKTEPTAKGRCKGKRVAVPTPFARRKLPEGELFQPDLVGLVPPGSHIWRGDNVGCWCGHLPPYKRISCSWSLYGHRESAVLVLRDLWSRFLTSQGLENSACPIQGLFAGCGVAALSDIPASVACLSAPG